MTNPTMNAAAAARELAARAAKENRGNPAPPIRNCDEDLARMLEGIEAATAARDSGDRDWMRFLRPMPVSYARLDEMRQDANGNFYVPDDDYLSQDAELFASQSHIRDEWTGIAQWQYQVQRLFEPGDYLHIKLIHGTAEWVWTDDSGKVHRKKKTQDVWGTYEEVIADASLAELRDVEKQGWNIYLCMAVFDKGKIQAAITANETLPPGAKLPRRTETNIATVDGAAVVRTVAIDCDEDGAASWNAIHEAVLSGTIPAPTIVIQSSASPRKKFQFMWAVKGFTLEQQAAVNASLQQMFGGDCKAKDTVRVLRLAGFANQKYEGKPPAIIVESSYAERYTFDRFNITTDAKSFVRGERPQASSDYKEFVCNQIEDNAEKAQFDLGNCKQYFGTGFIWVQDECPNAGEHTDGNSTGSYVIVMPSGARVFKCHHTHCEHLNWAWFKEYLDDLAGEALDWTDKKALILSEDEVQKIQNVATELERTGILSDGESENDPEDESDVSEQGEPEMDATAPALEIQTVPAASTGVAETETETDAAPAAPATPEEDSDEGDETKRGRDYYETFARRILELDELDTTPVCGAQIFQVFYSEKYVYAVFESTGVWMRWTGSIWTPVAAQIKMREAMHRLYQILPKYIAPLFVNNADKQKAVNALAAKFKVPNFVDNVCRVFETETYKMFTDFDHKKHLLNFYNGTLDLNTFTLRPHDPSDLLTKRMSISYNPNAKAPVWEQFLLNCFPNTDERNYLQTWAGYCTLGEATEKCAPFLYGPHDCGKTTIADIFTDILGPYAKVASWDSFKPAKDGTVRNDLADWHGARFVVCDEGDKRMVMDERVFKTVTGAGGKLKVRFFYKDFFEMPINFKIMFLTNFRPVFKDQDPATWSRVHPLRLTQSFAVGQPGRINGLRRLLRAEREGIAAWFIEGLKMYRKAGGIFLTAGMKREKQEYMAHSDAQAEFFAYRTVEGDDKVVDFNVLHRAYEQWCREVQETAMLRTEFKDSVKEHGYKIEWRPVLNGRTEYVLGLSLALQ